MKTKIRNKSDEARVRRHYRIKKSLTGTKERPRLIVHKSHKNLYVQFVNDLSSTTVLSASTNDKQFKKECKGGGNIEAAKKFGVYLSNKAKEKGIGSIVFDRGGYLYHGRIKALAESSRETGLKF